jgi:hypothetical protein
MTEMRHLRCDRCDDDILVRADTYSDADKDWASCRSHLTKFDFCPRCWAQILELAGVKREETKQEGLTG